MKNEWQPTTKYIVAIALVILLLLFMLYIGGLFRPLVVAGFMAYLLNPFVAFMTRRTRLPRKVWANVVFFLSFIFMIALISSLVPLMVKQLNPISAALEEVADQLELILSTPVFIGPFEVNLGLVIPAIQKMANQAGTPFLQDPLLLIENTSRSAAYVLIAVFSVYYFLVDWDDLREWLLRIAPAAQHNDIRHLYFEIRAIWLAYLRGQITLVVVVGLVFTVTLLVLGLPGALIIGPITGLLTLIPDIGPIIGIIIAVIVALLQDSHLLPINNFYFALLVAAVSFVLLGIKNVWLRPRIMGRAVKMHEGLVLISILAAVMYQGILGALIVVPVMASMAVIFRYLRRRLLGLPPFDEHRPVEVAGVIVENPENIIKIHPPKKFRKKGY